MSNEKEIIKFPNPIIKRNYYLIFNYLNYLMDSGLNYLKREYIAQYGNDGIRTFSASSFFEFILRDNIRAKLRNQMRAVLNVSLDCLPYFDGVKIQADELDKIIEKSYIYYAKNDMTLLHSLKTHSVYQELKEVSKVSFRVLIIQCTRLLACTTEDIKSYEELIRAVYKDYKECRICVDAILSMVDQMVDIYENNLDLVDIPFYKPTFSIRDFTYVRKIYEYALKVIDNLLKTTYRMGDKSR